MDQREISNLSKGSQYFILRATTPQIFEKELQQMVTNFMEGNNGILVKRKHLLQDHRTCICLWSNWHWKDIHNARSSSCRITWNRSSLLQRHCCEAQGLQRKERESSESVHLWMSTHLPLSRRYHCTCPCVRFIWKALGTVCPKTRKTLESENRHKGSSTSKYINCHKPFVQLLLQDLTAVEVETESQMISLLESGQKNFMKRPTRLSSVSSRSHIIVLFTLKTTCDAGTISVILLQTYRLTLSEKNTLHFADLAGSEFQRYLFIQGNSASNSC